VDILVWHVHGSWTTAFVQGAHHYLIPTPPERGPWGGGRPAAWDWPASAVEVSQAPGTGCCSTDPDRLVRALRELIAEPELARRMGTAARTHARARYGIARFLADWDTVLGEVAGRPAPARTSAGRTPVAAATTGRS
jgi:hypothetical protein